MAALQSHSEGRRSRGPAQMRLSGLEAEKRLRADEQLSKQYRAWKRQKLEALLAGPHSEEIHDLDRFMRRLGLADGPALIARVEAAASWIQEMDADARHDLLSLIGRRIALMRERNGLEPFNDGVPGDPPRAFERIKTLMGCR
ncbi:hypothetical protein [Methylobacterium nodulans]|uniref:Uncharacterized protein n=1 Tax=Methylobacterium nodulans (strain LMG 21967 / CNCM I-2342 / ORS 2060) TaxID=460265 RepID=B8IIP9_METNO|nr:hypothetical protein [Methylobacterium nodulans]ACL59926.1 hypothetical protein Mnod_5080 [Methylobacterium nodulans ORS 2060]